MKNVTLSNLVLSATLEIVEDEFDYNLTMTVNKRRKANEPVADIENLYKEFEV